MQYNYLASTRSLYIHWPFCPYKCHFCPFVAIASHDQFMERYHKALCTEIERFADQSDQKLQIDTIFLGGGTPSTYPDNLLLDMLSILRNRFDIMPSCEVTIEVNPGTVVKEQFAVWQKGGITRLSIGVQSLKDSVLKKLNRHQSAADVAYVINNAKDVFENVSIDLILGLPDVSHEEWKELLHAVVTWPIKHLSVYFLTVHEDTPLYFKVKTNKVTLPCDDSLIDLYTWSVNFLAEHGFNRYEISNFSRPGYESQHNTVYWERKPYKAFGLGACSFDGSARFQNEKSLMKYMEEIEGGRQVTIFSEVLTRKQTYLERVMLGIRRPNGVLMRELMDDLSVDEKERIQEQIVWLKTNGFVSEDNDRLILTSVGLSVENTIALQLSL